MTLGCSSKKNPFENKPVAEVNPIFTQAVAEIQQDKGSPQEKAEKFALLGQAALESPRAAHLAIQALEEALKLDTTNAKANFYSALLLPVLSLKGISVLMSEILTPTYTQEIVTSILKGIRESEARSFVSDFLKDEKAGTVFKTPSELQQFITAQFLPTLEESQRRLDIVSKQSDFKVTFNYGNWGHKKIQIFNPTIILDQVEVHSAKMAMKGCSVWAKIVASYNLDDALALRDKYLAKDRAGRKQLTFKDVVEDIKQYPKLLTLHSNGAELLKSAREDISATAEGMKIIANMLGTNKSEREGKLIPAFGEYGQYAGCRIGSCLVNDILSGPFAVPIGKNRKYENKEFRERTVLLDGTVIFHQPISDLKSLLPTEFDVSGKWAKLFPDVKFGGIVPNGDFLSTYCSMDDKAKNFDFPVVCPEATQKKTN